MALSDKIIKGNKLKMLMVTYNSLRNESETPLLHDIMNLILRKIKETGQYRGVVVDKALLDSIVEIKSVLYYNDTILPEFFNPQYDIIEEPIEELEKRVYQARPQYKDIISKIIGPLKIESPIVDAEIVNE